MSVGNATGITFGGISSGIDTTSIINALIRLDSVTLNRWNTNVANLLAKQQTYSNFKAKLTSLSSALTSLNTPSSYASATATSADITVVTASADSTALQGNYNITVRALASTQKVSSSAQSDITSAMNQTGSFIINGKSVSISASDSLQAIAQKVNGLQAGATASVVNGGTGNAFLTFTANASGVANAIQIADTGGNVLQNLGILNTTVAIRQSTSPTNALSYSFANGTDTLNKLTGGTLAGTFLVDGKTITADFSVDSLQTIANKVNSSGSTITATVQTSTINGATASQLVLSGSTMPGGLSDTRGILHAIGIQQNGFANSLQAASDATYVVDNLSTFTSSTNSVTGVIPGVTVNLIKLGSTSVAVTPDNTGTTKNIANFVGAYNDLIGYISANSQFDSKTFQTGPLFGDSLASQVQQSVNSLLFKQVGTGAVRSMADIGITLNQDGTLASNSGKLASALAASPTDVKNLLMASGSSTNGSLKFVTSGDKTKDSPAAGYAVNITQLATLTSATAVTAQTAANVGGEILTFGGSQFGTGGVQLYIDLGSTQAALVSKINSDSRLKDIVNASVDGTGKLQITSKRYGVAGQFTLASNFAGAANNSGVGTVPLTVKGVDVAGTINGESATGNGQFLLGNSGNKTTDGLQIQFTGSVTGAAGNLLFQKGVAAGLIANLSSYTDSVSGLFAAQNNSLQSEIDGYITQIASERANLTQKTQRLRQVFANMEAAMAKAQSQSQQLARMGY